MPGMRAFPSSARLSARVPAAVARTGTGGIAAGTGPGPTLPFLQGRLCCALPPATGSSVKERRRIRSAQADFSSTGRSHAGYHAERVSLHRDYTAAMKPRLTTFIQGQRLQFKESVMSIRSVFLIVTYVLIVSALGSTASGKDG